MLLKDHSLAGAGLAGRIFSNVVECFLNKLGRASAHGVESGHEAQGIRCRTVHFPMAAFEVASFEMAGYQTRVDKPTTLKSASDEGCSVEKDNNVAKSLILGNHAFPPRGFLECQYGTHFRIAPLRPFARSFPALLAPAVKPLRTKAKTSMPSRLQWLAPAGRGRTTAPPERWTKDELKELKALAKQNTPTDVLSVKLQRPPSAIRSKAQREGISLRPSNRSPYNRRKAG
jgi:hypothetical protein